MKPYYMNNCLLSYKCPLVWHDLKGSGKIRNCDKCQKEVFWCDNIDDLMKHAENQDCVAFYTESDNKSNIPETLMGVIYYEPSIIDRLRNFYYMIFNK